MTKEHFLRKLSDRLIILSDAERRDLIEEYRTHIDMKMAEGQSETEVIDGFGDFDELVAEILRAYHVDPDYQRKEERPIENGVKRIGRFLQASIDSLLDMDRHQVTYALGRLMVLALVFIAVMIVVAIAEGFFDSFFYIDGRFEAVGDALGSIVSLFFGIIRLAIFLYFAYFFFDRYVIDEGHLQQAMHEEHDRVAPSEEGAAATDKPLPVVTKARPVRTKNKESDERLMRFFYLVVKIFVIVCLLVPLISTTVGTLIGTVVTFGLAIVGWPIWGFVVVLLGVTLILGIVLYGLWYLLFHEGGRAK